MVKRLSGMQMSRLRKLVKAAVSSPHVSRVRIQNHTLTANSTIQTPSLLNCDDDPDYDVSSDGSNVAEVQPFSRITRIDLKYYFTPAAAGMASAIEWMLVKDPDQTLLAVPITPANLFSADITNPVAVLRKYALAYGWARSTSSNDTQFVKIRIRRQALARAGLMHDGDRLHFVITNPHGSVAGRLDMYGRIVTRGR